MSSLPSEIFSNITNFLPTDNITDLMLLSRKFNAVVTPRLKKIDQAKKRMKETFENDDKLLNSLVTATLNTGMLDELKERMSLERFDDTTFVRILMALVAMPKFREEYNVSGKTFNGLVTPRLQKINQEMATKNQSIKSFWPSPKPEPTDTEWISQLNRKKFEPIGSAVGTRQSEKTYGFISQENDIAYVVLGLAKSGCD
ncbi:hypothetical protein Ddc_17927 [Ditylenchus destructor]|nr:hypothetical protein Ddc_17927 [Ditylenchus destructor]